MFHGLDGCGAEPESWVDGWDKAMHFVKLYFTYLIFFEGQNYKNQYNVIIRIKKFC